MYKYRFLRLFIGMIIFSFGSALSINCGIGVNAWDTFSIGISRHLSLSYGTIVQLVGLSVLTIDICLRQAIGFGTVIDILIIGRTTDFFLNLNILPQIHNLPLQILLLLISLCIQALGLTLNASTGLSVGPRDSMLIALSKRITKVPVGFIKGSIELTVFSIGVLCGAPIGIGTLISVFGIGFILQFMLKLFHIDLREIKQENIIETTKNMFQSNQSYLKS